MTARRPAATTSPFYDQDFVTQKDIAAMERRRYLNRVKARAQKKRALGTPPNGEHGASAYSNYGCRCQTCRQAWREKKRNKLGANPSPLAQEVERLETELEQLREENAALRTRLDELEAAS